jgi:monovalent cation:proton antiporter-2 (CPA2) family protein
LAVQSDPLLANAVVFLGAAVVAVPIFKRLGLGSVLGYLAAGSLIGPFGLGLIGDVETVLHFAEFGVVLLLFVIGLELRPARLWRLRSEIFGLGLAQVAVTGVVLALLLSGAGMRTDAAILVGASLALSSTAFAVQILREKGDLAQPYGDRAFSILLFQDLAIVPLFALAALLDPGPKDAEQANFWIDAVLPLAAIGALIGIGRYALPPLFFIVARAKADEIFTAAALLVVIGAALAMESVGLSMALGAFIAGVLLAETEFRHQLESDIEPFRGLLLGLFFMGFGMTVNWGLVAANWWIVIGGTLALFAIKAGILYGLARVFGSSRNDAMRIAATIGQGGEFAFVLFGVAAGSGLLVGDMPSILSAIVTASLALTPAAVAFAERYQTEDEESGEMEDVSEAQASKIIVAGFGRVGQVVARIMRMRGYEVTLIDNSPRRIRMAGSFGSKVYYGDVRRIDVLKTAGADEADIIFLCIDDRDGARQAVERLKERFPNALLFVDTYDRFSKLELLEAGADEVVRETFESAIVLATRALERLGDGEVVDELVEEFRRRDAELTRLQSEYGAREGLEKLRQKSSLDEGF